ncbi:MAG: ABC transporter ATP-binding protein [Acidobacteriota bacterium]
MLQADSVTYVHGLGRRRGRPLPEGLPGGGLPGVHGVSLRADRGGIVGILGPNGSGKTTLLRLLGGLLRPASGQVLIEGRRVGALPRRELAARLAFVPQETHLAFDYSVLEVALMGRYPHLGPFELEGPRDLAIAREALDATGTAHLSSRVFATLSGGEKQRVVIASALAQRAGILLLDEPTASLDLGYQLDIANLLARLNRERGLTMVVATHDLNFAAGLCRSLVLIREGRVLADGPVAETLSAGSIRALYGVEAEVRAHERLGHVTVVPLARSAAPAPSARPLP